MATEPVVDHGQPVPIGCGHGKSFSDREIEHNVEL